MSKWKWMFGPVSLLFIAAAAPAALADESGGTSSEVQANVVTAVPVATESKDTEARRIREEAEVERLEAELAAARSHDEGTWQGPNLDQNNPLSP